MSILKVEFKKNLRGETTTNSFLPTGEIGGIVSSIESTLTNFKNKEAISLLDDICLPSIFFSAIKQNNLGFFDELIKYEQKYKTGLYSENNDEGQNAFHMIGFNNNSEHMMTALVKSNSLLLFFFSPDQILTNSNSSP